MRSQILLFALGAYAASPTLSSINSCESGYTLCAPSDATTTSTPQIGDGTMEDLYVDILSSSLPTFNERSLPGRGTASVCCISSLTCLTMSSLFIPFCYDKFTTNYYLPDGAYGTLVGGSYTSSQGDEANLQSGEYMLANGTTGNIYAADEVKKPDTATLPIPSQYTGTGIGGAIPASALGDIVTVTYTTTLAASTQLPTTISASTVPDSTTVLSSVFVPTSTVTTVVSSRTVTTEVTSLATTEITSTMPGTTVPATTLKLSTKESMVSVVTATVHSIASTSAESSTSSATTAAATSKKSGAERVGISWTLKRLFIVLLGVAGAFVLL